SSFFFNLWFLFPAVGGFFGAFLPLDFGMGILVGGLVFWVLGIFYHRRSVSQQLASIRRFSEHPNCPEGLRDTLAQGDLSEKPVEWTRQAVLDQVKMKTDT